MSKWAAVAVVVVVLVALVLFYRHEAGAARVAAARHTADCTRLLGAIGSLRRGLELTKRDDDPIVRHGTASLLLTPIVAVCTGDETFASIASQQFAEARTYRAAAAALQAVEDRVKGRRQ